jgi:hypothetical protein
MNEENKKLKAIIPSGQVAANPASAFLFAG